MGGTWETQNKVLPGVYINFLSNKPLAITPGNRGIVTMPLELSIGNKGDVYIETVLTSDMKDKGLEYTATDYLPIKEALKNASKVIVYNLGNTTHNTEDIDTYLEKMLIEEFNTMAYIYDVEGVATKIVTWIKSVRETEGKSVQAVLADTTADHEAIINVGNGVILSDGTELTAAQCCAWVAGATAGAKINQSLTNFKYLDAVDVKPRLTKTQQEEAITAGKLVFKANAAQHVTCLYDINSLTSFTSEKSKDFRKNRVMRVFDGINNDITTIIESNYLGKENNNEAGRLIVKATLIDYFNELQRINAIQNFDNKDVTVSPGKESDAIVVDVYIQPVDSVEKMYMTINVK